MTIKFKNKLKTVYKKKPTTKEEKIEQLIRDIDQNKKEYKKGKFFKGSANEAIEHLRKLRNENNNI